MHKETWITADWHLGENRFDIMDRPFETQQDMIDALVDSHNDIVSPDDMVIVVGDVCYRKSPDYLSQVERFNGKKVLIRGNHDSVFSDKELGKHFNFIVSDGDGLDLNIFGLDCYLTHYPSKGKVDRFNLVGHIHGAWKYQLNMFNVGVDANHFRPINADSVSKHFEAICKHYDQDVWAAYLEQNSKFVGKRGKDGSYFS